MSAWRASLSRPSDRISVQASRSASLSTIKTQSVKSLTTTKCTTFSDPQLRRGTKVSKVLGQCGGILKNCAGSAETFAMSKPVEKLDVFISHNWATKRAPKFLALALHFNLRIALIATLIVVAICVVLLWLDVLPTYEVNYPSMRAKFPMLGPYNTLLCFAVPMTVLFCGHHLMALFGVREPEVFLDKTCIHQTDAALQREGIQSLSAFLCISDEMLIIYTGTYLKRLWTVYELASMLMIQRVPRIRIVSTQLTNLLFAWWTIITAWGCIQLVLAAKTVQALIGEELSSWLQPLVWYSVLIPGLLAFVVKVRSWTLERQGLHTVAREFRIRSTVCCVDDDRKVVQENIAAFMRDFGFVPQVATKDQALDAFDLLTQRLVPLHLYASFGVAGLTYGHAVAMMLPLVGFSLDVVFANLGYFDTRWYPALLVYNLGQNLVLTPLTLWCAFRASALCEKQKGFREVGFIIFVAGFLVVIFAVTDEIHFVLYDLALKSWTGLVLHTLVLAFMACVDAYLYRSKSVSASACDNCKARVRPSTLGNVVRVEI